MPTKIIGQHRHLASVIRPCTLDSAIPVASSASTKQLHDYRRFVVGIGAQDARDGCQLQSQP